MSEAQWRPLRYCIRVREAAEMLAVSPQRVIQWIMRGRLAAQKYGGQWRISVESLHAVMGRRGTRLSRLLDVQEVASRWRLTEASVREAIRDGWLATVADRFVQECDVLDLEDMGMPARWRARAARGERLTPVVHQHSCGGHDSHEEVLLGPGLV